ncbi:CRISPR type AFERR-associated protein Csf1 [Burkholderia pseudomallei]|nr:CRISPR type AFERR-associated protein Csf1 [Burkholderia pseudomallei]
MKFLISPSKIATQAVRLEPQGTLKVDHDTACAVCGVPIVAGEWVDEFSPPDSFSNWPSLAYPRNSYRCSHCTTVMTRDEFLQKASTAIFTAEGAFPIMRKEHRAWAFLHSHRSPFVVAIQNARSQHTVWRAPVSMPGELFFVRVGDQVLRIRRPTLAAARDLAVRLHEVEQRLSPPVRGRPSDGVSNPFVSDWKYQGVGCGALKSSVERVAREAGISLEPLLSLSSAEAWALGAVLHPAPDRPEPLTL